MLADISAVLRHAVGFPEHAALRAVLFGSAVAGNQDLLEAGFIVWETKLELVECAHAPRYWDCVSLRPGDTRANYSDAGEGRVEAEPASDAARPWQRHRFPSAKNSLAGGEGETGLIVSWHPNKQYKPGLADLRVRNRP